MKIVRKVSGLCTVGMMAGMGVLGTSSPVWAEDSLAGYSDSQEVDFIHTEKGFEGISWDSGWYPSGSNLQLKVVASLDGTTTVEMGGNAVSQWPTALDVSVPGRADAGLLKLDYQPSLEGQWQLNLSLDLGVTTININESGTVPLPVGPLSNLALNGSSTFTPFVLPGANPRPVTLNETIGPAVVPIDVVNFSVGSTDLELGIELSAAVEMTVSYQSNDIQVLPSPDLILLEGGSVLVSPENETVGFGAFQDLAIQPHGTLDYSGELVLTATATLNYGVGSINYPLGEQKVPLTTETSNTDFNVEQVHVPLPDIGMTGVEHDGLSTDTTALAFGNVETGESATKTVTIQNKGEAELLVLGQSDNNAFVVSNAPMAIAAGSSSALDVKFSPNVDSEFTATLTLTTNDPDVPIINVPLGGAGVAPGTGDGGAGASAASGSEAEGGCGCRVVSSSSPSGVGALLLLCLGWGLRRKSRSVSKA